MVQRALIVCVGNICRSPMAEVMLRQRLSERALRVESAGLAAIAGAPIDPDAEAVLRGHGLSGGGHVARKLTPAMVDAADVVLAMEKRHLSALHAIAPQARGKIFLVGRWDGDVEVPDPYGRPRERFDETYALLDRLLQAWCRAL